MFGIFPLTHKPIITEQMFAWVCRVGFNCLCPILSLTSPHSSHFLSMYLLYHTHPPKSIGKIAQIAGCRLLKICTIFYLTNLLSHGIMENWPARGPPIITHQPPLVNIFFQKNFAQKNRAFPPYFCIFCLLTFSIKDDSDFQPLAYPIRK